MAAAVRQLRQHTGAGSDFHGWLTLPRDFDKEELARIHAAAEKIREDTDVLIVIGIGGSYLGARSAIELLRSPFYNALGKDGPAIYFAAGFALSSEHPGLSRPELLKEADEAMYRDKRTWYAQHPLA